MAMVSMPGSIICIRALARARLQHQRLEERILAGKHADEAGLKAIDKDVRDIVAEFVELAQSAPEPDASELYTDVLA